MHATKDDGRDLLGVMPSALCPSELTASNFDQQFIQEISGNNSHRIPSFALIIPT
jgi:hypothetical protein